MRFTLGNLRNKPKLSVEDLRTHGTEDVPGNRVKTVSVFKGWKKGEP